MGLESHHTVRSISCKVVCMFCGRIMHVHSWVAVWNVNSLLHSEGTNGMRVTRRARAKSLDNIQQTVTRGYLTHKGSIKTNFARTPDSQILSWLRKKLGKIGHGREDYSLFLFHKKSKFRKAIKRIVKSKYPSIAL